MEGRVGMGGDGKVLCATWISRPENAHLVVIGNSTGHSSSSLEIFSFDPITTALSSSPKARFQLEEGVEPVSIAVHPSGDDVVCSTSTAGCKLFELHVQNENLQLIPKDSLPLQDIGPQKCLAFSFDGSRFATGCADGHLRIFEWPNMHIVLDERKAHKSVLDMDFSLDSEFLASTSTDGSARIWKTDGVPVTSLERNSDEKIELCRFSKDGARPFLFCTVLRGNKPLTVVWDISTWKKIGHKRLLNKPASIMSMSLDGKYFALGSKDGDVCVVEVKKMEICHWSKRLHLGSNITSLEFCPSQRHPVRLVQHLYDKTSKGTFDLSGKLTWVPLTSPLSFGLLNMSSAYTLVQDDSLLQFSRVILTTSSQWGVMIDKLNVPADWKDWQIYLLLVGLFVASLALFYIFFENSDSFWNFPQAARTKFDSVLKHPHQEDVGDMYEL